MLRESLHWLNSACVVSCRVEHVEFGRNCVAACALFRKCGMESIAATNTQSSRHERTYCARLQQSASMAPRLKLLCIVIELQ